MKTNRKINNKGFTLVELIVVIAIIGILVAIAVPRMGHALDAAYHATLETNMKNVETVVMLHMIELDDDKIYEYKQSIENPPDPPQYLSRILELYLENPGEDEDWYHDEDNYNDDSYKNPVSGKPNVINWSNPDGLDADKYKQPAIYLTNDSEFSFSDSNRLEDKNNTLIEYACGSVIVYFDESAKKIEIFYVDQDGVRSDHCTTY